MGKIKRHTHSKKTKKAHRHTKKCVGRKHRNHTRKMSGGGFSIRRILRKSKRNSKGKSKRNSKGKSKRKSKKESKRERSEIKRAAAQKGPAVYNPEEFVFKPTERKNTYNVLNRQNIKPPSYASIASKSKSSPHYANPDSLNKSSFKSADMKFGKPRMTTPKRKNSGPYVRLSEVRRRKDKNRYENYGEESF